MNHKESACARCARARVCVRAYVCVRVCVCSCVRALWLHILQTWNGRNHTSSGKIESNKTQQDLTRLTSKAKAHMASEQGSHCYLCVTRPPKMCVNIVFKHIHAATQSVDNLLHSLIVLCEIEYFLISNLH